MKDIDQPYEDYVMSTERNASAPQTLDEAIQLTLAFTPPAEAPARLKLAIADLVASKIAAMIVVYPAFEEELVRLQREIVK